MRVLSLCDLTGKMVRPWAEAGHHCTIVDLQHGDGAIVEPYPSGGLIQKVGADLFHWKPTLRYDVVFAFPDCTEFAVSGARWWPAKGPTPFLWAMELVNKCRAIAERSPVWMIENPVGRLSTWWRKPDHIFDPCDYGGYLSPPGDAYTKRTCLWTSPAFVMPPPRRVEPRDGSRMHFVAPGPDRKNIRSATPEGFARAVYEANGRTSSHPIRMM